MAQSGTATGVSVLFAGDVCLEEDGFVLDYYDQIGGDLSQCVSPYLLNRMAGADLFMLNHEYSMSDRGAKLDKYYTFRANPSRVNILKEMSVDIVSLANNHTYDYGYDAFVDTLNILQENGIREVGAGLNASQAEQVQYYEINGVKIGIVSASRAEKYVITPKATDSNPGVFWMYDDTRLKEVVTEANTQCDFLVAYLHWGTEDSEYFENYQHNIAQELVDCGVDAIIGGHPHIVQGMEFIGDVPVIYSMGDFWFNGSDKYSMMAQLMVYKDGSCSVEIIPCRQRNYTINYIEDKSEQAGFFQYFSNLSPGVNFG
jgi:poly-gamma-glutamate synthesis protein (capsule biosynthesis protein)